ncbi:MAG: hypothetical protein ABIE43_04625 [Patescibacteria group bacterium]
MDTKQIQQKKIEGERKTIEKAEENDNNIEKITKEKEIEARPGMSSVDKQKLLEEIKLPEKVEDAGLINATNTRQKTKERQKQIEKVLEDDLEEVFLKMPPDKQLEFSKKGEETAKEINTLLDKTKFRIKKIINLIKKWLSIIPGINKFFLEQEAKIKADEIINLRF